MYHTSSMQSMSFNGSVDPEHITQEDFHKNSENKRIQKFKINQMIFKMN